MAPRPNWSSKLTHSVETRDGQILLTLADAREYILELPGNRRLWGGYMRLTGLLLVAAETGATTAATDQLRRVLFLDARLKRKR